MTQLESAKEVMITRQMEVVAQEEGLEVEYIRQGVAEGTIVIPANVGHSGLVPCGIGKGLSTKVNANIGTSSDYGSIDTELEKLRVAVDAGADAVMDLSTGGDIPAVRREVVKASTVAIGTVPIYQAGIGAINSRGAIVKMEADDLFDQFAQHAHRAIRWVEAGLVHEILRQNVLVPPFMLLGEGIDVVERQSQGFAHVADGGARPVRDDFRDNPGVVPAVLVIDVLEHLLAALVLEVDIDVRRLVAFGADETLEEQINPAGVDTRDAQTITNG